MKNSRKNLKVRYYVPEDCSKEAVTEMKSSLRTLNRKQLEMLICVLGQEIVKLEYELRLSNMISNTRIKITDCQTVHNVGEEPTQSNCKMCQRILASVASVSHFQTKHAGVIKMLEEDIPREPHLMSSVSDTSDNKTSCDIHLPSDTICRNMEDQSLLGLTQNNGKSELITDRDIQEHTLLSRAEDSLMEITENDVPTFSSNEKLTLQPTCCSWNITPCKSPITDCLNKEHEQPPSFKDNSATVLLSDDSSENQNWQKISHQDGANVAMAMNIHIAVQNDQALRSSRKETRVASKHSSMKSISSTFSTQINETGTFICCICKAVLQSKPVLTEHMKSKHKCEQYFCIFCAKSFKYKHNLKVHQRNYHNRSTVLCSHCGKLVLQTRIDSHMQKVHEKPLYTCHICRKGFLKRECLEGHINKHSNTKPYICEHCGRKYAYSTSLAAHKKLCTRASVPSHLQYSRHQDNKVASCICEICGMKFEGMSGLKDHLSAKHCNKFLYCGFCGKGFQWRPSYNRHIKKCKDRTELERDKCKQFNCKKPVGGTKYICVCGKQYFYRQSYRRHERSCHRKQDMMFSVTDSEDIEVPFS